MRNIRLNIIAVVFMFGVINMPHVLADDAYFGADVGMLNSKIEGQTFSAAQMRLRLGIELFNEVVPRIGIESHIGFDLSDDAQPINGIQETIAIDYVLGLYLSATMDLSDSASIYGLAGFAAAQAKGDFSSRTNPDGNIQTGETDSSISLAFGGVFDIPFNLQAFVEISQLIIDDFNILALSAGVRYKL